MANTPLTTLPVMDPLVPPLPRPSAPALIVVAPVYVFTKVPPPFFSTGRGPFELRDHPGLRRGAGDHLPD
jgi:hypothetical protein